MSTEAASPLQAVQADAQAGPEGVLVPLVTEDGTVELTVPPPGRWYEEANDALRVGDFRTWAEEVLSDADFETWCKTRKRNDDIAAFFTAWRELAGEDPKGSSRSQRSSRSTRKR
jgi:hypothetical protein